MMLRKLLKKPIMLVLGLFCFSALNGQAAEKVVLQLKWFHQFQFAGYYAAVEKGFYAEEGLEVEIRQRDPDIVPTEAVLNGDAQFGISDSSIVLRRLRGSPLVVVAALFQHSPLVLMTLAESDILSPLELRGKRVMFQRNVDDAMLTATFAEFGFGDEDYIHVPHSFNDDALLSGEVDAMSAYLTDQPFYYRSRGKQVNIISPANYGIDFYGDMLFVSEEYLHAHPDRVLAFRRATLKGWAWALENPEQVISWLKDRYPTSKSEEHLNFEAESTRRMIQPDEIELGHLNRNRFRRIAGIYQQLGLAAEGAELTGIHYIDHLSRPAPGHRWLMISLIVLALISGLALILWGINTRLKAVVKNRTRELEQAHCTLERQIDVLDRYVISSSADRGGRITQVSQAFCDISGFSREELIGSHYNILRHPNTPSEVYRELWQTISDDRVWSGELLNRSKTGDDYWVRNMIEPSFDENGIKTGYTAIALDITDRKRVERLSTTDALTELSNRRKLDEFLDRAIGQAARYERPLSLVIFDIDHFKNVNDRFGHQVGDRLLQHVARLTRERVRETDLAGRWGGEEFMIICPETDLDGAAQLAELLHQGINEYEFPCVSHMSCSFGVVCWQMGEEAGELFRRADSALYRAKESGRDRVIIDRPETGRSETGV